VKSIASHLSIAVVGLVGGGIGAAAVSQSPPAHPTTLVSAPPRPLPPEVRTVVVTRTIHRVRHIHAKVHRRPPAAAPPPVRVAVASAPVVHAAPAPVVAAPPPAVHVTHTSGAASAPAVTPTHVTTHTSGAGHGGAGGGEGDDGGDGGGGHDD
jgi:hypothetical protein